jgi:hypothetical protein
MSVADFRAEEAVERRVAVADDRADLFHSLYLLCFVPWLRYASVLTV